MNVQFDSFGKIVFQRGYTNLYPTSSVEFNLFQIPAIVIKKKKLGILMGV